MITRYWDSPKGKDQLFDDTRRPDPGETVQPPAQTAEDLPTLFDHTRPDGSSCFTALDEAGIRYRAAGENIAYGQRTPEQVVEAWMDSPGHRANILSSYFTAIGVGYRSQGSYWVQLFVA